MFNPFTRMLPWLITTCGVTLSYALMGEDDKDIRWIMNGMRKTMIYSFIAGAILHIGNVNYLESGYYCYIKIEKNKDFIETNDENDANYVNNNVINSAIDALNPNNQFRSRLSQLYVNKLE